MRINKRHVTILIFSVFILCITNIASAFVLTHGKDGGDCTQIGTWDARSKTCSLNRDVLYSESSLVIDSNPVIILVSGNGITVDGMGHSIIGSGGDAENGIVVKGNQNITIKNLTVTGSANGISLTGRANRNTISNVTLTNNLYGIGITTNSRDNTVAGVTVSGSHYAGVYLGNTVENNVISSSTVLNNYYGIMLYGTSYNDSIIDNVISNNNCGLYIGYLSEGNTVSGNTIEQANGLGVFLNDVGNNLFYNNNFISENRGFVGVYQADSSANTFFKPLPEGGNYWSFYDSPEEGCTDSNADGICDQPYVLNTGMTSIIDNMPWTTRNGWLK